MFEMIQDIPPSVLRAFEAAGRTGSFRAAAMELQLTPSAVSHAVRKLERTLRACSSATAARCVSVPRARR